MPEGVGFRVEGLKGFGFFGLGYQRKVFVASLGSRAGALGLRVYRALSFWV